MKKVHRQEKNLFNCSVTEPIERRPWLITDDPLITDRCWCRCGMLVTCASCSQIAGEIKSAFDFTDQSKEDNHH